MHGFRRLIIVPIVFLTACAQQQKPVEPEAPAVVIPKTERKAEVNKVSSWEMSGALAAKSKSKGWTASMNWTQRGANDYQIRMSGPLGAGAMVINKAGSVVTYKEGSKVLTSKNADELLQKQTGIRLPVNNLYYWVRALPAPGSVEATQYDKYNRTTQIRQGGYVIDYSKYTRTGGADLPGMVRLQGNGVSIKLAIKQWKVS